MNQAWTIFCLILAAVLFISGYEVRGWQDSAANAEHDVAQAQVTIAAEQHVIKTEQEQSNINQETENAYISDMDAIDTLYSASVHGSPASTGNGVPIVPTAPCRTPASRKYGLTPKQCDDEEAKCNALWNWAQRQSALK